MVSGTAKTVKWWCSGAKYIYIYFFNDMLRTGNLGLKIGVSRGAHTQYAYIWKYPPPPALVVLGKFYNYRNSFIFDRDKVDLVYNGYVDGNIALVLFPRLTTVIACTRPCPMSGATTPSPTAGRRSRVSTRRGSLTGPRSSTVTFTSSEVRSNRHTWFTLWSLF